MQDSSNHIVDVKQAEERLTLGDFLVVRSIVAHFADVVSRHHHTVIANEFTENLAIHQFKQGHPLGHFDVFHHIE